MDQHFGADQQRQRDQEADMDVDVHEKGHRNAAERGAAAEGQDHERQPRNGDEDADAPLDQSGGRLEQAKTQEELVERPAEHQREILRPAHLHALPA